MKRIFVVFISALVFIACKKTGPKGPDGESGPPGPPGATATGTISGKVTQFDELSTELTTGLNTVTVSIKGTSLSSVTDEKGIYSIPSVPPGVYVLEFKGKKTQACLMHEVSCAGAGIVYCHINLYQKPNWTFTNVYVRDSLEMHAVAVSISGTSTVITNPFPSVGRGYMIIFGKDKNLTNLDPSSYDEILFFGLSDIFIYYGTPLLPDYPAGSVYYARVYTCSGHNAWYMQPGTKQKIYYSVGDISSEVFTLTIPN